MRAEIAADGEERQRLRRIVCDNDSGYATCQQRAGSRVIPLVVLRVRPRADGGALSGGRREARIAGWRSCGCGLSR
jgi:hypothetical protein